MPSRKKTLLPFLPLAAVVCVALSACSRHEQKHQHQTQAERLPKISALPPAPVSGAPDLRPPQPAEAQEAIKRVYDESVIVESSRAQYFIAGDLNGDKAPDLAVLVRPAPGHLAELNHELANWIRCDPRKVKPSVPQRHGRILLQMTEPTVIEQRDLLLAVIHGYGPQGWRNPQARQSYLLKNAVGGGMKALKPDEAMKFAGGVNRLPLLRGDVVRQTLANEQGLLYYTGAKYAWHRLGANGP
ncbi:MAG: hypothetical protein AB7U82_00485 [Blastocatellales bacterium]